MMLISLNVLGAEKMAILSKNVIASGIAGTVDVVDMGGQTVVILTIFVSRAKTVRYTWVTHSLIEAFAPPLSTTNGLLRTLTRG